MEQKQFGFSCVKANLESIMEALEYADYSVFEEFNDQMKKVWIKEDADYILRCVKSARNKFATIELEVGLTCIINSEMQEKGTVILTDAKLFAFNI